MRIYYIDCGPVRFYGTADEAKAAARDMAERADCDVTVHRCITPDTREAMVALANGRTDYGNSRIIFIAKPNKGNQ